MAFAAAAMLRRRRRAECAVHGEPLRSGSGGQRGHRSARKLEVAQRASGTVGIGGLDVPFAL